MLRIAVKTPNGMLLKTTDSTVDNDKPTIIGILIIEEVSQVSCEIQALPRCLSSTFCIKFIRPITFYTNTNKAYYVYTVRRERLRAGPVYTKK